MAAQNAGAGAGAAAAGQLAPCVLGREKTKRYQIFQDWITQAEAKMQFLGITEDGRKIAYLRSNVSDVYQVDVTSSRFTSLPTNLQYEVLNGLKVKRKQNSWAKIHQMPQEAEGFSGAPHTYLFYMTIISFLPGFQLERLKRRREIQAKLEGVVEEVEEQREVVDPKLFVGDRGGFKKLKTRQTTGVYVKEKEVRELESSDDADDPDMSEAVALSLVEEGEPSHEEILEIIRKNGGSASTSKKSKPELDTFVIDDASDDEVVFIPTASLFSSNRLGGKSIKNEIKEEVEDVKEVVQIMSDNDNSSDGVGVMSGSDSDSEMSEEDKTVADDMFADIFTDTINVTELDAIILKAKEDASKPSTTTPVKTNSLANELLERVSKLDMVGDMFADISKKARKEVKPAED